MPALVPKLSVSSTGSHRESEIYYYPYEQVTLGSHCVPRLRTYKRKRTRTCHFDNN
ncbi:hypothetical protein ACU8KH_06114 [Lachancea thermotolerans]